MEGAQIEALQNEYEALQMSDEEEGDDAAMQLKYSAASSANQNSVR